MKKVHVRIEGRVQGVFFRDFTRREAQKNGLNGWVKNLPDGSVEALLAGEPQNIAKMLDWFHTGSPHSQVTAVRVKECADLQKYTDFEIVF